MKAFALAFVALCLSTTLGAQTIDDGIMLTGGSLQAGPVYTHESWDHYWEGALKRVNGNIGTVTTQTANTMASYGVTDRISAFGSVPFVWTRPSQGVLQGQSGVQDLMLGAKVSLFEISQAPRGVLRALVALSGTLPLTDYVADYAPLSIGNQSRRLSSRGTVNVQTSLGPYVNATAAYTVRSDVTLDRPYFYTNGQMFFTDQVEMPDVVDYTISVGYSKHDLNANMSLTQQTTQGGGDIRRQDAPFISNRMNFKKVSAMVMYPAPKLPTLALYLSAARTVAGRNVGQATTIAFGVLYSRASNGSLIR